MLSPPSKENLPKNNSIPSSTMPNRGRATTATNTESDAKIASACVAFARKRSASNENAVDGKEREKRRRSED